MARLVLNLTALDHYREQAGIATDQDLATRIGVAPSQVSRVLSGASAPGERFIAGLLDVFGKASFADLFDIEPDAA